MGGLWGLLTWFCSLTLPRTGCVASGDLLTFSASASSREQCWWEWYLPLCQGNAVQIKCANICKAFFFYKVWHGVKSACVLSLSLSLLHSKLCNGLSFLSLKVKTNILPLASWGPTQSDSHRLSVLISYSSLLGLPCSVKLASLLFPQRARRAPVSGPCHRLVALPGSLGRALSLTPSSPCSSAEDQWNLPWASSSKLHSWFPLFCFLCFYSIYYLLTC